MFEDKNELLLEQEDLPVFFAISELFKDTEDVLDILPRVVEAYIDTLESFEECRLRWKEDYDDLNEQLNILKDQNNKHRDQLYLARKLIDEEKSKRKHAEKFRDQSELQLNHLREALKGSHNKLPEFSEQHNLLLKKFPSSVELCSEINNNTCETTGSFMTDLSYTRDEDDFQGSVISEFTRLKGNATNYNKTSKKRRSSSAVRACEMKTKDIVEHCEAIKTGDVEKSSIHEETFLYGSNYKKFLDVPKDGSPLTPESIGQPFSINIINNRPHNFQQKSMLKGEICNVCTKRLRFSSLGYKCRECKVICHIMCKDDAPLPCLPSVSTPRKKSDVIISDFTPTVSPMVPSFVIFCIKEIEERGLKKPGLYLIPGSDKDIKAVKEKFLLGKVQNLSQIKEIHVICGSLKDFFRSLKDPLTTRTRWNDLAQAVETEDREDKMRKLCQIVSELPQPNRDTLAYLLLHLKKIVESPDCKMPISHLANVFGPTIIGYSSDEPENVYGETRISNKIMADLLKLPKDVLEKFINHKPGTCDIPLSPDVIWFQKKYQRKLFFDTPEHRPK